MQKVFQNEFLKRICYQENISKKRKTKKVRNKPGLYNATLDFSVYLSSMPNTLCNTSLTRELAL